MTNVTSKMEEKGGRWMERCKEIVHSEEFQEIKVQGKTKNQRIKIAWSSLLSFCDSYSIFYAK